MVMTVEKECFAVGNLLYQNSFIALFVSVVVSKEINRRHYFWSNLCKSWKDGAKSDKTGLEVYVYLLSVYSLKAMTPDTVCCIQIRITSQHASFWVCIRCH